MSATNTPFAPRMRRARLVGTLLFLSGFALLITGTIAGFTRADAMIRELIDSEPTGLLQLTAPGAELRWADIPLGQSAFWVIEAHLVDAPSSSLALEVVPQGEISQLANYTLSVRACDLYSDNPAVMHTPPVCVGEREIVSPSGLVDFLQPEQQVIPLPPLLVGEPHNYVVHIRRSPGPAEHTTAQGFTIGVGFHAAGPSPQSHDGHAGTHLQALSVTGSDAFPITLLAAGVVCVAAALLLRRVAAP